MSSQCSDLCAKLEETLSDLFGRPVKVRAHHDGSYSAYADATNFMGMRIDGRHATATAVAGDFFHGHKAAINRIERVLESQ